MTVVPDSALDKHVALLGMTGAGKTSVIKRLIVEPDLEAGRRALIITPKDDWWGLRLSKSGKSSAFDIPIFGGMHEDYPLRVQDAALLAETYATMKGSAIFCTAKLSVQDRARWFAAFAEKLLYKNRGWVRVVIDEAHTYMPKQGGKGGGAIPAGLHAGNELVSQGRSQGLRIVLASQRSAKLHNDALTQCACLIALQLMAPHDRQAVKDWIEDQADPVKGKEIIASLSQLKPGEGWVWAPLARFLERVQFPRPATFDSSSAPADDDGEVRTLPAVNLGALQGKLAAVEAEVKANDPKALKAEVARLKAELERKAAAVAAVPDAGALAAAEARGRAAAEAEMAPVWLRRGLEAALEKARALVGTLDARQLIEDELKTWRSMGAIKAPTKGAVPATMAAPAAPVKAAPVERRAITVGNGSASGAIGKGERAVLTAVAQHGNGCTKEQLTVITGYKRSSRDAYIQRLRAADLVIELHGRVTATAAGVAALGDSYQPLPTGSALRDHVLSRLPAGERNMLAALVAAYPNPVARDELSAQTGYQRSSRDAYIQRLSARELVKATRDGVTASETLFD